MRWVASNACWLPFPATFAALTCTNAWTMQGKRAHADSGSLSQQTLQASMAGVDGCVVILSDTTPTEGEEAEAPPEPEQFVLLDDIPQVGTACWPQDIDSDRARPKPV